MNTDINDPISSISIDEVRFSSKESEDTSIKTNLAAAGIKTIGDVLECRVVEDTGKEKILLPEYLHKETLVHIHGFGKKKITILQDALKSIDLNLTIPPFRNKEAIIYEDLPPKNFTPTDFNIVSYNPYKDFIIWKMKIPDELTRVIEDGLIFDSTTRQGKRTLRCLKTNTSASNAKLDAYSQGVLCIYFDSKNVIQISRQKTSLRETFAETANQLYQMANLEHLERQKLARKKAREKLRSPS